MIATEVLHENYCGGAAVEQGARTSVTSKVEGGHPSADTRDTDLQEGLSGASAALVGT